MSTSPSKSARLAISAADNATEIFLIDASLRRIASGLGQLEASVKPGIYKVRFRSGDFKQPQEVADLVGKPALGALVHRGRGLLMLCENEGRIDLGSRTPGICSVAIQGAKRLAPSQRAFIGRTFLIAFDGDALAARDTIVADVQGRVRLHEHLRSKRAMEDG